MSGITGLVIEPHLESSGQRCIVWYQNGERVAVVYVHEESMKMNVIHESQVRVTVTKRTGRNIFHEVSDSGLPETRT